jgi:hypothetical protein
VSTLAPSALRSPFLERITRQLLQTYGPAAIVVLTSAAATHSTALSLFTALAGVVFATTVKLLAKLKAGPDAPLWIVVLDRAGSAFATLLVSLGITDWFGLIHLDWDKALTASFSAAAIAFITYFVAPPQVQDEPSRLSAVPAQTDDQGNVDEFALPPGVYDKRGPEHLAP